MLRLIIGAIEYILPAYVANAVPVVVSRIIPFKHPVDFGRLWRDGRRILGDSKTIEGLIAGLIAGTLAGLLEAQVLGDKGAAARGVVLATGALLGDMLGSFIKRRLGKPPGSPAPLLDQLDFLFGALALGWAAGMAPPASYVPVLVLLTLVLHPLTNGIAYLPRLKRVPW